MRESFTTYILLALIAFFGTYTQYYALLNADNGWLIHSAQKLLAAENLYTDYVETNPPFIVYFTAIPIFISNYFGFSAAETFQLFTVLLVLVGAATSVKYLESPFLKVLLFYLLFVLSALYFGQREHVFIALILPWAFAIIYEKRPNWFEAILASVGLMIKPYFIIFFIGFVLWQWLVTKRGLFLRENFIIGTGLVLYAAFILVFERDYLTNVLPLLIKYYDSMYYLRIAIGTKIFIYSLLPLVAWGVFGKGKFITKPIAFALFAAFLGGLTLIIQDKGWTNHFYPLYFFLVLALMLKVEQSKGIVKILFGIILTLLVLQSSSVNLRYVKQGPTPESVYFAKLLNMYAKDKEVIMLGVDLSKFYPEMFYAGAKFGWEYPHLWMMHGMYKDGEIRDGELVLHKPAEQNADEVKIFKSVVNYVVNKKPAIIIVANNKIYMKERGLFLLDYIKYYSQDPVFAEAFSHYRKIKQINGRGIYILDQNTPSTNIHSS